MYSEKEFEADPRLKNGVRRLRSRIDELEVLIREKPQYDSAQVRKVLIEINETVIAVFGDKSRRVAGSTKFEIPYRILELV